MTSPTIRQMQAAHLHQPHGWLSPGFLEIDEGGTIVSVAAERPAGWDEEQTLRLDGYVIPGMVNLHSHAHHRGLAGHGEGIAATAAARSFWDWRSLMYRFVGLLSPEDLEAIAAQAYLEMVEAGFTTVGEFHYLHHDRDGSAYGNPAELSERILAAAEETGIGLTLLPSLYAQGGIGQPPQREQARFVHGRDGFLVLLEQLLTWEARNPLLRVGVAPHSLRAVSTAGLQELVTIVAQGMPDLPIHIHAAEQRREVEECLCGLGAPPVRWLLDQMAINERWTIIHATHMDDEEVKGLAASGAVAGLCPITEANLGDGLFSLVDYHRLGGRWGIGTDSNTAIGVVDELRILEYGQRLMRQRRDTLVTAGDATTAQPGRLHYDRAVAWGAQSLAQPVGAIEPGKRADLVELDADSPALVGHGVETVFDGWLFGSGEDAVRSVFVAGRQVVREGRHERRAEIRRRFGARMRAMWAG